MRYGYHFALRLAKFQRDAYRLRQRYSGSRPVHTQHQVPCRVIAFSGARDLPEQHASLISFLRHVGAPRQFTVVSDGSHDREARERLAAVHPSVEVVDWTSLLADGPSERVLSYARVSPMGKKLAVLSSLDGDPPTLYVDSDILFFPGAVSLRRALSTDGPSMFLRDCEWALDASLLDAEDRDQTPVNGGFLLIRSPFDWQEALARFEARAEDPTFHTEQTVVHLAMHANNAAPFPPDQYVMEIDDMFDRRSAHSGDDRVLRHYVRTLRYKFWNDLASSYVKRLRPTS